MNSRGTTLRKWAEKVTFIRVQGLSSRGQICIFCQDVRAVHCMAEDGSAPSSSDGSLFMIPSQVLS